MLLLAIVLLVVLMFILNQGSSEKDVGSSPSTPKIVTLNNDMMEKIVLAVNQKIKETMKVCSYIIETTAIKSTADGYQCMFMAVTHEGFPYGFAVSADVQTTPDLKVTNLRTQPLEFQAPSNVRPFEDEGQGEEFLNVFESTKNKPV